MLTNGSPYWIRLNGTWIRLEGVSPGTDVANDQASSEFISVDGYRWAQQAPRGPRTWSLSYEYAEADSVPALRVASATLGSTTTLFLDTSLSQQNMLAPEDCYGTGTGTLLAGSIPLQTLDLTAAKTVTVTVRSGITYNIAAWTSSTGTVGSYTYPGGGPISLTVASGKIAASFTPTSDGTASVALSAGKVIAGLMVNEGSFSPTTFLAGQRMPTQVSIDAPTTTTRMTWRTKQPQSYADYTITVREVG